MTALYAAVGTTRATSVQLTMPTFGRWSADVVLAEDVEQAATGVTLTVGNLTLVGAVTRQAGFAGARRLQLVGGAGGWDEDVTAREYRGGGSALTTTDTHGAAAGVAAGGVLLSTILRDAALEVGETVKLATGVDRIVGPFYVREVGPASRVLRQLVDRQWWIDGAGVTQIGPRPSARVASDFLIDNYEGAKGRVTISTEDLASWMPGATFSNALIADTQTASSVSVVMGEGGKLRLEVMVGGDDRLLEGFRALVRAEMARSTYAGCFEYSVSAATATTFDGRSTATTALPDLVGVPTRVGLAGAAFTPAVGSLVLVEFVNGDPTRPVVVSYDAQAPAGMAIDSTGTMTVGASAGAVNMAAAAGTVLRSGDYVALAGVVVGANPHLLLTLANIPVVDPDPSKVKA